METMQTCTYLSILVHWFGVTLTGYSYTKKRGYIRHELYSSSTPQGCGKGCNNVGVFLGFYQKKLFKKSIFEVFSFLENLKNPDFRLTVTAENCFLPV